MISSSDRPRTAESASILCKISVLRGSCFPNQMALVVWSPSCTNPNSISRALFRNSQTLCIQPEVKTAHACTVSLLHCAYTFGRDCAYLITGQLMYEHTETWRHCKGQVAQERREAIPGEKDFQIRDWMWANRLCLPQVIARSHTINHHRTL